MTAFVKRHWFPAACCVLLAGMAAAMAAAMLIEVQNWDEGIHLAAGYSYWKTGDFRINPEHPPLFKLVATAPLLLLSPDLPVDSPRWRQPNQMEFAVEFMYKNRVPADRMLLASRSIMMVFTLALGLAIALWTRRRFGALAALLALFLYTTDPNFIAHGHYVTNDVFMAFFAFVSVIAWVRFLDTRRRRDLALAAVVLGLALVAKFSAIFLLPVFGILGLLRLRRPYLRDAARMVAAGVICLVISAAIIAAVYGPATKESLHGPKFRQVVNRSTFGGEVLYQFGKRLGLPAHPYLRGVDVLVEHSEHGHRTYLLGEHSRQGWWYYFPVLFAVKTPTAVLALAAAALAAALWRLRRWRKILWRFEWAALALPFAAYWASCLSSNMNIGLRHLLPAYPFLFVMIAAALLPDRQAARRQRLRLVLIGVACAFQLFEVARIHPHYTAFFNTPAGGPGNGPRYAVDSNIDWGTDLKKLRRYLESIGWKQDVCMSYFGRANMAYYGIHYQYLPETKDIEKRASADCLAAISVTQLYEVYTPPGTYAWLREKEPVAKVGYSMYIYDLRKKTP